MSLYPRWTNYHYNARRIRKRDRKRAHREAQARIMARAEPPRFLAKHLSRKGRRRDWRDERPGEAYLLPMLTAEQAADEDWARA